MAHTSLGVAPLGLHMANILISWVQAPLTLGDMAWPDDCVFGGLPGGLEISSSLPCQ